MITALEEELWAWITTVYIPEVSLEYVPRQAWYPLERPVRINTDDLVFDDADVDEYFND